MRKSLILTLFSTAAAFAAGKQPGVPSAVPEVKVLNEAQPAGGTVQVKFSLTEPTPISTGTTSTSLDNACFDFIDGIQLFSTTGDVFGVAMVQGLNVQVRYVSPRATFGLTPDYPILTIAAHIRDTTPKGHIVPLGANAALSGLSAGQNQSFSIKPGTLTIGGSVSIQNVIPGGGAWPAGTVVQVLGSGFQKGTSIRATTRISSSSVVSPNEIDIVLAESGSMDGTRIDVKNPDGSADSYFSYQRGVPQAASAEPLLNAAEPLFSSLTYSKAVVSQYSRGLTNSMMTGLAIQNPNAGPVVIKLEAYSALGESLGHAQVVLPFRGKILQELGEYFGTSLASNSLVSVTADSPVQFLGVLVDKSAASASAFPIGK